MKAVSLVASLLVVGIGALVLIGWALDIGAIKSVLPGLVAMKANTAAGLVFSGLGLSLLSREKSAAGVRFLIAAIAAAVIALGAVTLGEYLFGWNPGIDQWLFREGSNTVWTLQPGRMAPVSAFCFMLVGGALLASSQRIPDRLRLPIFAGLGTALAVMGALAMAGCMAEVLFHAPAWNDSGLAIHTALAFLLLGCALLALAIGQRGLTWWLDAVVTAGFVAALAIMLLAAGVSYNFTNRLFQTASRVGHSQEVLKEIEKASGHMAGLQSDERGYVITGDEKLLEKREATKAAVRADMAELRDLTAGDAAQQSRLGQLDALMGQRLDFEERTIASRRQQGFAAAQQMTGTGTGFRLSAEIRGTFQAMQDEEFGALDLEQKQSREASMSTFLVLPLGVFLSLTISSVGLFFLNSGVGERVRMEQAWRRSEERFQTVIENLTEGLVISGLDGQLLHWNPAALSMHGFASSEEWCRQLPEFYRIFQLSTLDGTVLPLEEWPMSRVIRGEEVREVPIRIRRLDVDWERVFTYGGSIVREPSGERLAFVAISDITERTRSEEALRASEIRLGSFVEQAPVAMAMLDRKMIYLAASWRWVHEFAGEKGDLVGQNHYDVHPDVPAAWREVHRQGLAGIPSRCDEELWVRADGSRYWLRWTVQPWHDAHGLIGGIMIVSENISDRKQAEQIQLENLRLEEENRRFAEASRLKSEFLANMSHELRTPLYGVVGFTELLAEEKPGPVNRKQQEYLGNVLSSARHLLQLINDVLDLAKVEAGKFKFEPASFVLHESIDEVCAVVRGVANRKQVQVRSETAPGLGSVTLDEQRFKQICYNLLSNAVKFTDAGGSVEIAAAERDAAHFEVRVTDTGIGIKEENIERLFREFEQLESGASRRFEGTGLGLALTKKLVELQGGSIGVRSEYGKGSTFTVVLPKVGGAVSSE